MNFGAKDYRDDLDVLNMILEDKRTKETQQLKLQIATQCLVAMLSNSATRNMSNSSDSLAQYAWTCATRLLELSQKEEKK